MGIPALRPRRAALPNAMARQVEHQKLLQTPICDLRLSFDGQLGECIEEIKRELRSRGLTFVPEFYLGDDDFWTADRALSVNVPWYLANPDLWRLVNDHLFRYTRGEVLMYLRHETGHALGYAFELWKRRDWGHTFGDFRRPYRDVYNPSPWTRDYVRYLHRTGMYHYAQKHPDEDWAETFAVWLDPSSRWRHRYRDWQVALAKLEYVDRILEVERTCRGTPPNTRLGSRVPYGDLKETVAEYFEIDHTVDEELAEHRKTLIEIFPRRSGRRDGKPRRGDAQSAARFIQQHQRLLTDRLSGRIGDTGRRRIKRFLRRLEAVCTSEDLVVPENRRSEKLVDLTVLATWHALGAVRKGRRR
jgi:hypothetical protein